MSMSFMSRFFLLVLIMLAVIGCNGAQRVVPTPTPIPTPTVAAVATPSSATMTNLTLGEVQTIVYNGFTFRPIEGWTLSTESDSVSMESPGAQVNAGPGFFITGGYLEDFGVTSAGPVEATEMIIQSYISALIPVEESFMTEPRRIALPGLVGNDMEFAVPDAPQPYRGRITVFQQGNQILLFLGLTPPELWDDDFETLYDQVLRETRMVAVER